MSIGKAACDDSRRYWTRWRRQEEARRAVVEQAEAQELIDWERVNLALYELEWQREMVDTISHPGTVVVTVSQEREPDVYGDEL